MTDARQDPAEATRPPRNRYARWRRTLPAPVGSLVTAGMVFVLAISAFTLLDLRWPTEGMSRVDHLVIASVLAIGMGAGEAVARWRYGRDVFYAEGPASWRAFALYLLVMAALMIGLFELAGLLIG